MMRIKSLVHLLPIKFQQFCFFILLLIFSACDRQAAPPAASESKQRVDSVAPRTNKGFLTDCKALYVEAKRMDSILLQEKEVNDQTANKAIIAFADYANYCHNDSLSPIYLIKTAQVARAINNIPQAKMVLDECIQKYPDFKDRPAALFLLAQLYDEDTYLNNESEAKKLYQQILDEYPKSDWASSAKGAMNFIGKSDQQIMQELTKKHSKK